MRYHSQQRSCVNSGDDDDAMVEEGRSRDGNIQRDEQTSSSVSPIHKGFLSKISPDYQYPLPALGRYRAQYIAAVQPQRVRVVVAKGSSRTCTNPGMSARAPMRLSMPARGERIGCWWRIERMSVKQGVAATATATEDEPRIPLSISLWLMVLH